jgi:hypothetical protein
MKPPPNASMRKRKDLAHDRPAFRGKLHQSHRHGGAGRQPRVEPRGGRIEHAEERERGAHRVERRKAERRLEESGQRREQAADRVARIEQHVVPGEHARAVRVAGGRGQERLLDDRDRAAVAPVHVEHADERREREDRESIGGEEERAAQHRQQAQRDQERALRETRAEREREQRRERRAPQRARQDDSDAGGRKAQARSVQPDEHRHESHAQGAQECGGVEDPALALAFAGCHPRILRGGAYMPGLCRMNSRRSMERTVTSFSLTPCSTARRTSLPGRALWPQSLP